MLSLNHCRIDLETGRVIPGGPEAPAAPSVDASARLSTTELALLRHLATRPDRAVSRQELMTQALGYSPRAISRAVDTAVQRLRQKIEQDPARPEHVLTVYGVGYRFAPRRAAPAAAPLLGRAALLYALRSRLLEAPLVTLVGLPGAGKTRLAREALPEAPLWTDRAAPPPADCAILDGADADLDAAARDVGRALAAGGRLLVTSRARLRAPGEVALTVGGLDPESALRLFRVLAPSYDEREPDRDALLAALCGIPRWIERAATRWPDAPEAILAAIDPAADLAPGLDALDPPERRALDALIRAPGAMDFSALAGALPAADAGWLPMAVEALIDRGWVEADARRLRAADAARRWACEGISGSGS